MLYSRANKIKFVLTDVDGVLTDTGVYYSSEGEELKRFSIRDGMGVERLRNEADVQTGIITGETSGSVVKRAEKLRISELHLGIKDKMAVFRDIIQRHGLKAEEVAYIGDDVNDLDVLNVAGLSACPNDAISFVRNSVHYVCRERGGNGAFRELAELIIDARREE